METPSEKSVPRQLQGLKLEDAHQLSPYQAGSYQAYSPVLMRFHSPDNMSPFDKGGLNAYAYCAGDPVNFNDPAGH